MDKHLSKLDGINLSKEQKRQVLSVMKSIAEENGNTGGGG